jgi:hypothetical protein
MTCCIKSLESHGDFPCDFCGMNRPQHNGGQCYSCGAKPGDRHTGACAVMRCSGCGGQALSCSCEATEQDYEATRWTGTWPGAALAEHLGLWSVMGFGGWQPVPPGTEGASADINSLYEFVHKVLPTKQERADALSSQPSKAVVAKLVAARSKRV